MMTSNVKIDDIAKKVVVKNHDNIGKEIMETRRGTESDNNSESESDNKINNEEDKPNKPLNRVQVPEPTQKQIVQQRDLNVKDEHILVKDQYVPRVAKTLSRKNEKPPSKDDKQHSTDDLSQSPVTMSKVCPV